MVVGTFVKYKGYIGTIEYDPEDRIYHGSLLNSTDSISYHTKCNRVEILFNRYKEAIDRYIKIKETNIYVHL